MMKVNIGLDIGIASVGWAILDQELKIVKHGVRLFPTVDNPKDSKLNNATRREKRSMRRQKNRRRNLKLDFIKLLKTHQLINLTIDPNDQKLAYYQQFLTQYIDPRANLFVLRQKGLKDKLNHQELIQVLYWYLSHRGFKYELADDKAQKEKVETLKKIGQDFSPDELPIDIQSKYFEKNKYYRSELNRLFSMKDYLQELNMILKNSVTNISFLTDYLNLFTRQRSFEVGPGPKQGYENLGLKNYQLISPYSRYYVDPETQTLNYYDNIWDKTIGKCTYFHEEFRAPKNSLTAEIFNLLNDLNNLSIGHLKLSPSQKLACLKIAFTSKTNTNSIIKWLVKTFNVEKNDIKGFRIDKSGKPLTTPLTSLHFINDQMLKFNHKVITFEDIFSNNKFVGVVVDQVVDILAKTKIIDKRVTQLSAIHDWKNNDALLLSLAQGPSWSETHALSYKVMQLMIPMMLETHQNQMQIAYNLGWKSSKQLNVANQRYIPKNWIEDLIGTPTVKRALRQTINLLNDIFKQHKDYQIDNIVIEMAREHNNAQVKEHLTELQKFMETRRKNLSSLIEAVTQNYPDKKIHGQILAKLWLYEQQKGLDAYSGEVLDLDKIVTDPSYVDIDHVIPHSQCFDDSRNNKVLTRPYLNSRKGQQTPYQWLQNQPEEFARLTNLWIDWYGEKNNVGDRKIFSAKDKLAFITSQLDYSDPQNAISFIKRNLVDTRNVTRQLLSVLNEFKNNVGQDHMLKSAKIKTVNGRMTNFYRKMIEKGDKLLRPEGIPDGSFDEMTGKKLRIWNGHHAEDAVIIIHIALKDHNLNKVVEKVLSNLDVEKLDRAYDKWFGLNKEAQESYINHLRADLNLHLHDVKFSYMLNKKTNIQFFNESLYSIKAENDQIYKVEKLKLVELKTEKLTEIFAENTQYQIPMKTHDPKTFDTLKQIFQNNANQKLPFKALGDQNQAITISLVKDNNQYLERKIKSMRIINPSPKDVKTIIMRDNNKAFYESMNWTQIHLFKNSQGVYRLIPINALVAHYKNDGTFSYKDLYWQKIVSLGLQPDAQPLYIIHRGTIIVDQEHHLYRVCGLGGDTQLELKRLDGHVIRRYWGLNTKLLGWHIVQIDYLGNIFHQFTFTNKIITENVLAAEQLKPQLNLI